MACARHNNPSSIAELADRVRLSPSPCLRRVRRLASLPGVARLTSQIVMKTVKPDGRLPL